MLQDGAQVFYQALIKSRIQIVTDKVGQIVFIISDFSLDDLFKCWLDLFQLLAREVTPLYQNLAQSKGLEQSVQGPGQSLLLAEDFQI